MPTNTEGHNKSYATKSFWLESNNGLHSHSAALVLSTVVLGTKLKIQGHPVNHRI